MTSDNNMCENRIYLILLQHACSTENVCLIMKDTKMTSRVVEETIEPQKSELGFLHDKQTKSFYFEKFCKNLVFVTLFISKSSATDHKKI